MEKEESAIGEIQVNQKTKFSWWRVFFATAIVLVIYSLAAPDNFVTVRCGELTRLTHGLKQVNIGLIYYEEKNKKFPPCLENIFTEEFINPGAYNESFERTPKMTGLWWYNVGIAELGTNAPSDTPLIVSPSVNGKYAILRIDGIVKQMYEKVAMKVITDQNSTWVPIMGFEPTK